MYLCSFESGFILLVSGLRISLICFPLFRLKYLGLVFEIQERAGIVASIIWRDHNHSLTHRIRMVDQSGKAR